MGVRAAVEMAEGQVVRCWHPEAPVGLGWAFNGTCYEILVGDPAYQLSTGAIVAL